MKSKFLLVGAVSFLILVLAVWWFFPKQQLDNRTQNFSNDQDHHLRHNVSDKNTAGSLGTSDNTISDNAEPVPQEKAQPFTQEEFKLWLTLQAQSLEAQQANPLQVERAVREQVQQLSLEQKNELVKKILDQKTAISERIFANYALALEDISAEAAPQALQRARQIIEFPVPKFANPAPHTIEETQRVQEYALRFMQIDRLVQLIKDGDAVSKNQSLLVLRSIAAQVPDAKIRAYAQQKLKEI